MDKSTSVSVKGVLVAGLILLGLSCAYLLGGAGERTGVRRQALSRSPATTAP
ncbi:MAG: hypothetical protein L0H93_08185 [Nocardioides sp.]|nr:hypothetical protein [Nocardioides sp.]